MKMIRTAFSPASGRLNLVRCFGQAALVSDALGRWKLLGGKSRDRQEAREWISLFCHEALVDTSAQDSGSPMDASPAAVRPISLV